MIGNKDTLDLEERKFESFLKLFTANWNSEDIADYHLDLEEIKKIRKTQREQRFNNIPEKVVACVFRQKGDNSLTCGKGPRE